MSEPIFIKRSSGLTVGEIATLTGADPAPAARLDQKITNIASLDLAGSGDLTFFDSTKFAAELAATCAGVCLLRPRYQDLAPRSLNVLRSPQPYEAFVDIACRLFPDALRPSSLFNVSGTTNNAKVHET